MFATSCKTCTIIRTLIATLCVLVIGMSVGYAQEDEDSDTATYEDVATGVSFDYPAVMTEVTYYEEEGGYGINAVTSAELEMQVLLSSLIAETGIGQAFYEGALNSFTPTGDADTAEYANAMFEVTPIENPELGNGYILYTQDRSYDFIIAIVADNGMEDNYLETITSTLDLPEIVEAEMADTDTDIEPGFETSVYEDPFTGISFEHPVTWTDLSRNTDAGEYVVSLFDENFTAGVDFLVADSEVGNVQYDNILESVTVLGDESTVEYSDVTYTIVEVEFPVPADAAGYILSTGQQSYDLVIRLLATDDMQETYLDFIMNTLVIPERTQAEDEAENEADQDDDDGDSNDADN